MVQKCMHMYVVHVYMSLQLTFVEVNELLMLFLLSGLGIVLPFDHVRPISCRGESRSEGYK